MSFRVFYNGLETGELEWGVHTCACRNFPPHYIHLHHCRADVDAASLIEIVASLDSRRTRLADLVFHWWCCGKHQGPKTTVSFSAIQWNPSVTTVFCIGTIRFDKRAFASFVDWILEQVAWARYDSNPLDIPEDTEEKLCSLRDWAKK